jgi:hypothetical protein
VKVQLSQILRDDVSIICEFWPYSELSDFDENAMYPRFIGLNIFPIKESSWWVSYFDRNNVRLGEEKFPRFPSRVFKARSYWVNTHRSLRPETNCKAVADATLDITIEGQLSIRETDK